MDLKKILIWCLSVSFVICTLIYFINPSILKDFSFLNRIRYSIDSVEFPSIINDTTEVINTIKGLSVSFTSFNADSLLDFVKSIYFCIVSFCGMFVNILYIPIVITKDIAISFYSIFEIILHFVGVGVQPTLFYQSYENVFIRHNKSFS